LGRAKRMASILRHRGPDHSGAWADETVGLGHARLAVVDLSHGADQPMADLSGQVVIVFNGEIYNCPALRTELESVGLVFRTCSDTEVILNGYLQWGTGVFAKLRGMFALAIHDRRTRQLVLGRDRIGKKPLYYYDGPRMFAFGSEIKAILANDEIPRRPNLEAIHDYLTLQYTPSPLTAFESIHRLPPAHFMVVGADGRRRLERYWKLCPPDSAQPRRAADLGEEFLALVEDAVRVRMVADVPVGALLSGGIDSSTVVAMMAQAGSGTIKTFSAAFDDLGYDETAFAGQVAARYGTEHHVLRLGPDCVEVAPRLAWHYGEPFADPSAIPTFLVSEFARREVTVVLTGDGGDESMLGYPRYQRAAEWGATLGRPTTVQQLAAMAAAILPTTLARTRAGRKLRHMAACGDHRPSRRYAPSIMYFMEDEKIDAYGPTLRPLLRRSTLDLIEPYFLPGVPAEAGAAWADLHTYLPDDLLVKVDVASMAFGLEARAPLLDHHLLEWAARLPAHQKTWDGEAKALFKAAVSHLLPRELIHRPKMGFGVPIESWLTGPTKALAHDLLCGDRFRARGLIRPDWLTWALARNDNGRAMLWHRIWALMMLELWYREWIDPATIRQTPP